MYTKTCVICGKKFDTKTSNRSICYENHHHSCPVCGKDVISNDPKRQNCACSRKCGQQLGNISRSKSNLEKYGVENVSQLSDVKEKISSQLKDIHPKAEKKICTCVICGKQFEQKYSHYESMTCSSKCRGEYRKRSGIAASVSSKSKQTLEERYGVSNVRALQHFVKTCKWCGKQFETSEPRQEYCGDDWGNCPVCGKLVKIKDYSIGPQACSEECRQARITETNVEKYGSSSVLVSDYGKQKSKASMIERYGVDHYSKTLQYTKKSMSDPDKVKQYAEFKENPRSYVSKHYEKLPTIIQLSNDLGVTDMAIYEQLNKFDCKDIVVLKQSTMEHEVFEFISSFYSGEVILHDRKSIAPQEIDIYVPEFKVGFECNPTYTHNSSKGTIWSDDIMSYDYHCKKSMLCRNKGIFVFHVFGYDWSQKQDIIKSMIKNLLRKSEIVYYARNLEIRDVSDLEAKEFLIKNHRQGYCNASVRIGLYSDDELVSLMTFGKIRNFISKDNESSSLDFELLRFCSKLNTSVVGGASKLFKYFVSNPNVVKIVSFSDIARTKGTLYSELGFTLKSISEPGYVWVNTTSDTPVNRIQVQKQHIQKFFNDDTIDIKNKTERQIMIEHGYVQVYDSGVMRWEYDVKE